MFSEFRKDLCFVVVLTLSVASFFLMQQSALAQKDSTKETVNAGETNNSVESSEQASRVNDDQMKKNFAAFEKMLSNTKLTGNFTVVGQEKKDLTPEEYTISEVKKMDEGDYWLFKVRIKYQKYNLKVPVPLEVKWAGNTPIVSLDNASVPGFGKFNARVVFHENKYSGTWSHGKIGGHLFGTIKKMDGAKEDGAKEDDKKVESSNGESQASDKDK